MNTFQTFLKTIILFMILFDFACSSTNKNIENQNSEVTKVESLPPTSPAINDIDLLPDSSLAKLEVSKEITNEDIFQGRDMSQYKKENTSNCNSHKCVQSKVRRFIWEHWQNKESGYIENELQGIDVSITDYIFIEPDEAGKWRVIWKVVRRQYPNNDIEELAEVNVVEQVKSEFGKNSWKLVFKDEQGKIITTL